MPTILAYLCGNCQAGWHTVLSQVMDADQLRQLARQNKRDKTRAEASYAVLLAAIWEASDEGWRQTDIVQAVGLTRERVRQICDPAYRAKHERRPDSPDNSIS